MAATMVFRLQRMLGAQGSAGSLLRLQSWAGVTSQGQVRHKTTKKARTKAPHEPKEKARFAMKGKVEVVKDTRGTDNPKWKARQPVDDVWLRQYYPRHRLSLEEAVTRHREFAQPAMLNNESGLLFAEMELNMSTTKKTKFMSNIKATKLLPHAFDTETSRRIVFFSKSAEDVEKAKELGAVFAGGTDLVQQIKDASIDKEEFDFVLSTPDILPDLLPIRTILKDKFPAKNRGNLSVDLDSMFQLYLTGVTYESRKEKDAVGRLQAPFGRMDMSMDNLRENFQELVNAVCSHRNIKLGPFIKEMCIVAPLSTEKFWLALKHYVPGYEVEPVQQEQEEEEAVAEEEEAEEKVSRSQ